MLNHFISTQLPITHPVHIFAVMSLIILLAPIILTKLRLPGTVGLILAGVIIGPNGLNILAKDASIVLFGTVGILYIMFLSGLEVDFLDFKRSAKKSLVFGLFTFAIPQVVGTLLAFYVLDFEIRPSLLLASMYASHTLLAYPIASRLGITRNESVLVTIGGTLVTNTISLSILAIITSSVHGTLDAMFWALLMASFTAFSIIMFVLLPRFARWFFCNVESEGISQFMFILALVFTSASIAHLAGIEPVIGAFLAGLSASRLVPAGSTLLNRINFTGNALFIPYFLIYVGMLVDLRVLLGGPEALIVAATMTLTAISTKWAAAFITQKVFGYSSAQRGVMFGLSNAQAANTLAAVMIGYQLGLLNENVLNGTIVMIFVTCVVSAFCVERSGMKVATSQTALPSLDPASDNQRILVPVANFQSIKRLMEFAAMIKDKTVADPVYPLAVITDVADTQSRIAEAETLLREARTHASAGETPVRLISRIDISATGGILRVIRELNITCVVLGWSNERSTKDYFFGTLHEHLLDQSTPLTFVNGVRMPLNTIRRLVVILAPNSEFAHGFGACLDALSALRRNLKVLIAYQGLSDTLAAVQRYNTKTECPNDAASRAYESWDDMPIICQREMKAYDLTIFMTARKGCIAWDETLEHFARKTHRLVAESNVVLLYAPAKEVMVGSDFKVP